MLLNGTCPRCQQAVSPARLHSLPAVCEHCGFVLNNTEKETHRRMEDLSFRGLIAAAVVIVLGFMQVVSWGGHAIEVLPLQAARLIGLDSLAANEHLARICLDLKKYECVERSYKRLAFAGTPDGFLRLGKFQNSRLEYAAAAESFRQFFARGGRDLEASYGYARALGEIGRVDEASRYYDHVLAAKPDVLQITVVHNYVKALVDHGRLDQALKVISTIRRRGQSVSSFMDSEYKDIKQRLRART